MTNSTFLILLLFGAVILGAIGGYFVFLGIYQEQFTYQDRITLENFETAIITLQGTVKNISSDTIEILRDKTNYLIHVSEDTLFLAIPELQDEALLALAQQGQGPSSEEINSSDLQKGMRVEVTSEFRESVFTAIRIIVFRSSAEASR